MNSTERYYQDKVDDYINRTLKTDLSWFINKFVNLLPHKNSLILDVGSGLGRDTLVFLDEGLKVEAIDSSSAMCEYSTKLTGVKTLNVRAEDLSVDGIYDGIYDGVWASASLHHIELDKFHEAINRLYNALKSGGIMFMSLKNIKPLKEDEFGRYYLDIDEAELRSIMDDVGLHVIQLIKFNDYFNHEWLQIYLKKE